MFLFLCLLLATIIAYIVIFHNKKVHAFHLSLKINGPPALPLIGNGLMFLNKSSAENFDSLNNLVKQYGDFVRVWFGTELNVFVSNPKDVEILLSSPRYIGKSTEYKFMKPWLNEGLLLSGGKKWHDRRKVISPAFHFNKLEKFVEVFDRLGNTVVNKLKTYDVADDVEFYPIAVLYTLDVMCETAMGVSIDALSKPNSEYVKAVKEITCLIQTRAFDFILRYPLFFQHSKMAKQQAAALRVLHGFTDDVIKKRRQELLTQKININANSSSTHEDEENESVGIRKKLAFLDLLLNATIEGKPLTDLEIREEVDTFMFEGHDTTTSGITFCLYNIAKYPEVQKKCFSEIVEVFGTNTKEPTTLAKLNQLPYLEMTVKETLRIFPSVPLMGRLSSEDIKLTENRVIPAGSNILVPIYVMGHNEKYFDDPETFKPERFLSERSMEKQNAFTYIPFAAGPRNCIGQKFAMYEIKTIVSKILRNFEIVLTNESETYPVLCTELVLRSDSRISFYFKPRVY